MAFYVLMYV